jgi:phosphoribosyl 1,2-cyclic phosphate phosphodiesterase
MVKQVPFKISFLGTGTSSGVPMIACNCNVCISSNPKDKRLRSSILITTATTTVVIDTTPDFRQQMLRENVKKLDAVVFTHPHKDHIAGLDDVRGFNFFSKKDMPLYVNEGTEKRLRNEFDYAFADIKYEGVPLLNFIHINATNTFMIGDIFFTPIQVMHYKMPVLGFRIGDFTYITDANKIEEKELEKIKGTKTLVLNALRKAPHLSHFTLQEATNIALQLKVDNAYFTHISHQLGLHNEINNELPNHIQLAYDGLVLDF